MPLDISGEFCGKDFNGVIEGGKGVGVTNWNTSGNFASNGAAGTLTSIVAQEVDGEGNLIIHTYNGKNRVQKHQDLIAQSIKGVISNIRLARELSSNGIIGMNSLWEGGSVEKIITGILSETQKDSATKLDYVISGAGMPYKLGELCEAYDTFFVPIISSKDALRPLWKRGLVNQAQYCAGIAYECAWTAGGHNGITGRDPQNKYNTKEDGSFNKEEYFEDHYKRILEVRTFMNESGFGDKPIIIAGGVWYLDEFQKFLDNKEIGKVFFQFGTRPIATKESPISDSAKTGYLFLNEEDILAHWFSPTGYSSTAINNDFLQKLQANKDTEMYYSQEPIGDLNIEIKTGIYISTIDKERAEKFFAAGRTTIMKTPGISGTPRSTPEPTIIFVTPQNAVQIKEDIRNCIGCIKTCAFSGWSSESSNNSTGKIQDPRSMCISKTLTEIGQGGNGVNQLAFTGTNGAKFRSDPLFWKGGITPDINPLNASPRFPSIKELVKTILTGR